VFQTPQERQQYMLTLFNTDTTATVAQIGIEPQTGNYYLFGQDGRVAAKEKSLTFYDNDVDKSATARYAVTVPLSIPFTYAGAKFVVLKQYGKENFLVLQKWGGTISTGVKATVKRIH
jgi:hypothetical protein